MRDLEGLKKTAVDWLTKKFNLAPEDFSFVDVWDTEYSYLLLYNVRKEDAPNYGSTVAYKVQ